MLNLLIGPSGSGKTHSILARISALAAQGQTAVIWLVPEQYSFESERAILNTLGPVQAASVRVLSFSRLADMVAREVGGLAGEINQLKALFPDFQEMPDEVARACAQGVPLLTAYLAYRSRQSDKAAADTRRENAVLKQNASAAAKAPVRAVGGGGQAQTKVDPMLDAFDSDDW